MLFLVKWVEDELRILTAYRMKLLCSKCASGMAVDTSVSFARWQQDEQTAGIGHLALASF